MNRHDWEWIPTRKGWGQGLVDLAERHEDVIALVGDNTSSLNVDLFEQRWPDRFLQMGIAEMNMANVSAGLARAGKAPFYVTYSAFGVGRAFDQLRVTIGYSNLPVTVGGGHSGISVGPDGATHQMLEDLALVCALPNFTVFAPVDYEQTRRAVQAAYEIDGPVYIRFGREAVPCITTQETPFHPGQAQVMAEGQDATCIAIGQMVSEALIARNDLAAEGIGLRVLNMHTLKPLDEEAILAAARETAGIITAEEHQIHGGLNALVSQVTARQHPCPVRPVAVMDSYGRSGQPEELLEHFGLTADRIAEEVRSLFKR